MMDYGLIKEQSVTGRYVTLERLHNTWFQKLKRTTVEDIGLSVLGKPIKGIYIGTGPERILMWSQMHGNESTTTKAILDIVNFLLSGDPLAKKILKRCSLCIVPILNPDGAKQYTRENANGVDLNRDAKELSQPESQALRNVFEKFEPHYCFNLHDQRTLFGVGDTDKSATISFLSPASDPERKMNPSRETAMRLIVGMNEMLQSKIPGQVGRYDDSFNANCVGDTFQMLEVPTILFEAGHYPDDYEREKTREYIFDSILKSLEIIGFKNINNYNFNDYFSIPENRKSFFDVLVRNPYTLNPKLQMNEEIGVRYKEVLQKNSIRFEPEIASVGKLDEHFGHLELDCQNSDDKQRLVSRIELYELIRSADKK